MVYEKVKRFCDENGKSIMAFEKECGLGNGTIGGWNKLTARPSADSLLKVARVMGTTIETLLEEDDAELHSA